MPFLRKLSKRESEILDSTFGGDESVDIDMEMPDASSIDVDGFSPLAPASAAASSNMRKVGVERTGSAFKETKMLPLTLMTDGNTATQVVMLLEMIRYCMEKSKEIIDSGTGEAKEYDIHLKVRNRGKSNFLVSMGDESMEALPVSEEPWFIGN